MKLLLTSNGLVPEVKGAFLELLDKKPEECRVRFVPTASYANHPDGDAEYVKDDKRRLSALGIGSVRDLDLRGKNEESVNKELSDCDIVFVEGGNTFYLLKYMKESGFDRALKGFLGRGGVYVGVSAGSYVAAPDISPAQWKHAEDQNVVGLKDLSALHLVNFYVSPHYKPDHKNIIIENRDKVSLPIFALTDSQAISIKDGSVKFIGTGEFKKF